MKFINQKTGEVNDVTPIELRLGRLKSRLSYYSDWFEFVNTFHANATNIMLTLTYRGVNDWRSNHINEFMRKIKRLLGSSLLGYCWVAEMQERGAVHYHVILTVKKGVRVPKPDNSGLWAYGMTKVEKTVFSIYGYLGKYLSKGSSVPYPKGIRIFGCSVRVCKKEVAENKLPVWLRNDIRERFIISVDEGKKDIAVALLNYQGYKKIKGGWKCGDHFFDSPYAIKDKFKKTMRAVV